jgi:hypothetical protein
MSPPERIASRSSCRSALVMATGWSSLVELAVQPKITRWLGSVVDSGLSTTRGEVNLLRHLDTGCHVG